MDNLNNRYNTVENWLHNLKWKPCVVGVIIGCVCTSVLGLSIGLIVHPYLTSLSTSSKVNGGWSSWEQYGSCSVNCGEGVIPIVRRCDNPSPTNGGIYCVGESYGLGTCLLEACLDKNIALHKKTRQSSLFSKKGLQPYYANDGITLQNDHLICAHTQSTFHAWWAVDLGDVFDIKRVVLYGRTDCCTARLSNFDIDVFKPIPSIETTLDNFQRGIITRCHYQAGEVPNHVLNASCAPDTTGKFLRVRLRGFNYLSLCEVEVYATDNIQNLQIDKNFIYGEPYAGPDIREMKGVLGENCSNFCQTGADQDCITSFLPHYNLCVVAGFTSKP